MKKYEPKNCRLCSVISMNSIQSQNQPSHFAHYTHRHLLGQRHFPLFSFLFSTLYSFKHKLVCKFLHFFRLQSREKLRQLRQECQKSVPHPPSEAGNCNWPTQTYVSNALSQRWLCLRNKCWSHYIKEIGEKKRPLYSVIYWIISSLHGLGGMCGTEQKQRNNVHYYISQTLEWKESTSWCPSLKEINSVGWNNHYFSKWTS